MALCPPSYILHLTSYRMTGEFGREYWTSQLKEDDDAKWILTHSAWSKPDYDIVGDDQGRAFLFTTQFRNDDPTTVYIYFAYTLPVHRNQGIISKLVKDLVGKWNTVVLEITDNNEKLIWFWEARGFRYSPTFSEIRGLEHPMWAYQGVLPRYEHFSLHRPFYYIVNGINAYPVNKYHDKLGCHPYDYLHPLNRLRLRLSGRISAYYEKWFQEELQKVLSKYPAMASIYATYVRLEDLEDRKAKAKAKKEKASFWRPYANSYYPPGELIYLYQYSAFGNTLSSKQRPPWEGEMEERLYEERIQSVAARYVISPSWIETEE